MRRFKKDEDFPLFEKGRGFSLFEKSSQKLLSGFLNKKLGVLKFVIHKPSDNDRCHLFEICSLKSVIPKVIPLPEDAEPY